MIKATDIPIEFRPRLLVPTRWEVKREGDEKVYALTNTKADADLLAYQLSRKAEGVFYAKEKVR